MPKLPAQVYKEQALKMLPSDIGVYALCDLDETPIYVGRSKDGILARVRRHLTSARSDVIANRQIDVWEIAYVWGWPVADADQLAPLEAYLFQEFNDNSPLVNGTIPSCDNAPGLPIPERIRVQVMDDKEITARRDPTLRYPRQVQHFGALIDYVLNTQDKPHLRRALQVYFERLARYHADFVGENP